MVGTYIPICNKEVAMQHYSVSGMSCAACAGHVVKAVAAVPGVTQVTAVSYTHLTLPTR